MPIRIAFLSCSFALLFSCSTPPRSTRITVGDIEAMGAAMAQDLAGSDALRSRTPQSPPWTVSISKVTNLSSDVMTESEQWLVMARLRSTLPIDTLEEQKNIEFVLPPEKIALLRNDPDAPELGEGLATDRHVTHVMTATFRSVTRATRDQRSELYYCEFELIDLARGLPVWSGRFEYKRQAKGKIWD